MKIKILSKECPYCHMGPEIFEVEEQDYKNWKNGVLIQNAFPYLNKDQAERLITGIDNKCWDELFKSIEEEF